MSLVHLCCSTCRRLLRVKAAALSVCTHSLSSAVSMVGLKSLPKSGGILAHESKPWCVQLSRAPSPGGTSWCPLARRDSGCVSRDGALLAAPPAGIGTMGTGRAQDVSQSQQSSSEVLPIHTHTHSLTVQWV